MGENDISGSQSSLLNTYELLNALGGILLLVLGLLVKNDFLVVLSGIVLIGVTFLYFADSYKLIQSVPIGDYVLGVKATLTAFLLLYFSIMTEDFITGFIGAAVLLFGTSFLFSSEEEKTEEQSVAAKNMTGIILVIIGFLIIILGEPAINYSGYIIIFTGEGMINEYVPPVVDSAKAKSNQFLPGIIYGLSGLVMFLFSSAQLLLFTDFRAVFSIILGFIFTLTGIYLVRMSMKKLIPADEMQEID
ncbi:MAG: hypothetical protein ACTSP4_06195 [Candidatus Hodarchaeales archaeon]